MRAFVDQTGIPVGETMAGKGSLRYDHPLNLGAIGATGTLAANRLAHDADLVIGIGTRYSDFTTASKTAFQNPDVRFININVTEFDAAKHYGLMLVGDARATLEELAAELQGFSTPTEFQAQAQAMHDAWDAEVERIYALRGAPLPSQGELFGALNTLIDPSAIMVNAAGSMPGDLHKLWRATHPKNFHMEYGYSCMGYEIAGGLGVKMAAPERDVYVIVGDASYLMLSSELVTSIQEGFKLNVILLDNHGYKSIGSLSRSLGQDGFATRFAFPQNGVQVSDSAGNDVETLPIDFAENAHSLGAHVIRATTYDEFTAALQEARTIDRSVVIVIQNDRWLSVPGYEAGGTWWWLKLARCHPCRKRAKIGKSCAQKKSSIFNLPPIPMLLRGCLMSQNAYKNPLHQTVSTTPTDLWNDSCSIEELTYAIDNGAVGATTNPSIVLDVLKKEMPLWKERIFQIIAAQPELERRPDHLETDRRNGRTRRGTAAARL